MGSPNYQIRLQALGVLDDYKQKLSTEQEKINNLGFALANLHESYADEDRWNDVKHSQYKDTHIEKVQGAVNVLRETIAEAINGLEALKHIYGNAGVS